MIDLDFRICIILVVFGISISTIFSNIMVLAQISTKMPPRAHGVKILHPTKGQKIQINNENKSLIISGTSIDNATSDCQVSVIINNVRPYQNATAIGPNGNNDYSKWNFKLTSHYTMIKEGINKITAKFLCNGNPEFLSYYSVNVTGVSTSPIASTTSSNAPAQKNIGAASTNNNNILIQNKSSPINSSKPAIVKNNEPFVFPIPSTNSTIKPLPSQSGSSISGSSNNNEGHHHKNKKSHSDSLFGGDPFFK